MALTLDDSSRMVQECQAKRDALNMEIRRSLGSEDSKEKYEQAQIRLTELQVHFVSLLAFGDCVSE